MLLCGGGSLYDMSGFERLGCVCSSYGARGGSDLGLAAFTDIGLKGTGCACVVGTSG